MPRGFRETSNSLFSQELAAVEKSVKCVAVTELWRLLVGFERAVFRGPSRGRRAKP